MSGQRHENEPVKLNSHEEVESYAASQEGAILIKGGHMNYFPDDFFTQGEQVEVNDPQGSHKYAVIPVDTLVDRLRELPPQVRESALDGLYQQIGNTATLWNTLSSLSRRTPEQNQQWNDAYRLVQRFVELYRRLVPTTETERRYHRYMRNTLELINMIE